MKSAPQTLVNALVTSWLERTSERVCDKCEGLHFWEADLPEKSPLAMEYAD